MAAQGTQNIQYYDFQVALGKLGYTVAEMPDPTNRWVKDVYI
jgi:hypothetical protein